MHKIERQGVLGAAYDDATRTLRVTFARGAVYEYEDVPRAVFEWLCRSPEPGGYVQRILTPRYRYHAVTSATRRAAATEQDLIATLQASLERLARAPSVNSTRVASEPSHAKPRK